MEKWTEEEMATKMNKIHNMDCIEFIKTIPSDYFDVTMTDIPYGAVNRDSSWLRVLDKGNADIVNFDTKELLSEINRITTGTIIMFCGHEQYSEIFSTFNKEGMSCRGIVWEKTNPSPMNAQHLFVSGIEICVFARKPNAYYDGEYSNTVFRYKAGESKIHPTQKPIELWKHILNKVTNGDSKVFDPFMGSGTTAEACKSLGIDWCGCELDKNYHSIANNRIQNTQTSMFAFMDDK